MKYVVVQHSCGVQIACGHSTVRYAGDKRMQQGIQQQTSSQNPRPNMAPFTARKGFHPAAAVGAVGRFLVDLRAARPRWVGASVSRVSRTSGSPCGAVGAVQRELSLGLGHWHCPLVLGLGQGFLSV